MLGAPVGTSRPVGHIVRLVGLICTVLLLCGLPRTVFAQGQQTNAQAAGQLGRGEASTVILPISENADFGGGAGRAFQSQTILDPVVVFDVSKNFSLISNTELSVQHSDRYLSASATGFGDIIQNTWLSPAPISGSMMSWGMGAVLQAPTASPNTVGQQQWALGPSGFVSIKTSLATVGLVINHPSAFAGRLKTSSRLDRLYMFPFINIPLPAQFMLAINGDVARTDVTGKWAAPITVSVTHPIKIGGTDFAPNGGVRTFAGDDPGRARIGVQVSLIYTFSR